MYRIPGRTGRNIIMHSCPPFANTRQEFRHITSRPILFILYGNALELHNPCLCQPRVLYPADHV